MASRTLGAEGLGGCPHCGAPLAVASGSPSIDRPLQQCASCAGIVLRPGANEWDLLKTGQKLGYFAHYAFVALAVGPALPLVHLAVELGAGGRWRARDSLVWLAAGWLLAGAWQASRLITRIRHSRRRMGDPMYLAKLVEYEIAASSRR